jgi:hypothetical protein
MRQPSIRPPRGRRSDHAIVSTSSLRAGPFSGLRINDTPYAYYAAMSSIVERNS